MELLLSLAKTEVYETLLFGCKIMDDGKLERPKMFTGSGPNFSTIFRLCFIKPHRRCTKGGQSGRIN